MNAPIALVISVIFIIVIIVVAIFGSPNFKGIPVSHVLSHWSHYFKFFSFSSDAFYDKLKEELIRHDMPNTQIRRTRHKEAGILSANREYLQILHGEIVFDVCAAPFGNDFFISWWLYESHGKLRRAFRNTKFGDFLNARAEKRTFYQIDEEDMFRSCVHESILETIEAVASQTGFTLTLTDAQKQFKMGGV